MVVSLSCVPVYTTQFFGISMREKIILRSMSRMQIGALFNSRETKCFPECGHFRRDNAKVFCDNRQCSKSLNNCLKEIVARAFYPFPNSRCFFLQEFSSTLKSSKVINCKISKSSNVFLNRSIHHRDFYELHASHRYKGFPHRWPSSLK